jgi:beta-lactamase class A
MAMLHDTQKILLGDALSVSMREKLESWMIQNTTGNDMIRAGVPRDWRVGTRPDKIKPATATISQLSVAPMGGQFCFVYI